MQDVASRLANRVQLTTDGHKAYLTAVDDAFEGDIDYAMLIKIYVNEKGKETKRDILLPNVLVLIAILLAVILMLSLFQPLTLKDKT